MKIVLLVLRMSCFLLFIGRAWQHLFWDIPIRELLWDQTWMEGAVKVMLGLTWEEYVSNPEVDTFIQWFTRFLGILYLLGAMYLLLPLRFIKKFSVLPVYSALLLFLAFLYWKEKYFFLAEFFEYSGQFLLPLLLHVYIKYPQQKEKIYYFLLFTIAITFTSHGLYAVGFYPVPGNFIDMIIVNLGVTEQVALQLLFWMGILDFILAVAIFFPYTATLFLSYALVWGTITSLSRIWATFNSDFPLYSLHQWIWEVLCRLPHAGLPLAALLLFRILQRKAEKKTENLSLQTLHTKQSQLRI